jgi:hypothetical protein
MTAWTNCALLIMLIVAMIYSIRYVIRDTEVMKSQLFEMMINKEVKFPARRKEDFRWKSSKFTDDLIDGYLYDLNHNLPRDYRRSL